MEIPGQLLEKRNRMNDEISNREIKIVSAVLLVLVVITLLTSYYGSADVGDYADTAKFFAGDYKADIRSSHSYLLGLIHAPFLNIFGSFIVFKISSLIFLFILIYSVYIISGKSRKALWMIVLSPVIWYMAPWINPIQIASIFLLWSYYFIKRYDENENIKNLIYSALLIGLGWAFWDTILYFGVILGISFLYNKKIIHGIYFSFFIIVGLAPRLILDQILFNFAFYTSIKTFISGFVNIFGGIYGSEYGHTPKTFGILLPFLLAIPILFWNIYKIRNFRENKKEILFFSLSILLLLMNPQIRYLLALVPIMILYISKNIDEKKFKLQIIYSIIIILLFVFPYIIQISYGLNNKFYGTEVTGIFIDGVKIDKENQKELLFQDLKNIEKEYENKTFVVGNHPDNYQVLAHFYSGEKIKKFVSIQDYELWKKNESIIYKKRFEPVLNIDERRQIWIEGGIKKNKNDKTDYEDIKYGLGIGEPIKLDGFSIVKKYGVLYLSYRQE